LTTEVSSAVLVGAQASNAERVPFLGRPDHNLLLHFWPVVMGVGEAWQIKLDGDRVTEEPIGYVLTVPDVTALSEFVRDFAAEVATLSTAMAGYRPRDAVLALPEEGGLDYLTKLSAGRALQGETRFSVAGVEVYHLAKQGNNIRLLATGRVPARRDLVRQFEAIGRTRNLLFRAQLIRNLLAQRPWYDGIDRIFARYELGLFMGGAPDGFAASARRRFRQEFGLLARGEVDRERV
jgi:CRISPR-associated protein Cmx8